MVQYLLNKQLNLADCCFPAIAPYNMADGSQAVQRYIFFGVYAAAGA